MIVLSYWAIALVLCCDRAATDWLFNSCLPVLLHEYKDIVDNEVLYNTKHNSKQLNLLSRLIVVCREAKKEQSEVPKAKHTTNHCVSFTRANVFVI